MKPIIKISRATFIALMTVAAIQFISCKKDNGTNPSSSSSSDYLYGMTSAGGTNNKGIVFRYDISSGKDTIMHNFGSGTDGAFPHGSLIKASNGLLYGMTQGGGTIGDGIIFSYDISTGAETDIHDFGSDTDGAGPDGSLIQARDGMLYGMTFSGGASAYGMIFSYNITSGKETDLHDFTLNVDEGRSPAGSFIQASNGLLYGTTFSGGANALGTIFSYDISTGTESDIHDFGYLSASDGNYPVGSLIQASNDLLYGMTLIGGIYSSGGIVFSYNISTGTEADIHDFGGGALGVNPQGSLVQASNGLLYGMTSTGNANGSGIIFGQSIATGAETDIHDFGSGTDIQNPYGSLIQASNGLLYGMTFTGGSNNSGIIFSYNISTGTETDIHDFGSGTDGTSPYGDLLEVK